MRQTKPYALGVLLLLGGCAALPQQQQMQSLAVEVQALKKDVMRLRAAADNPRLRHGQAASAARLDGLEEEVNRLRSQLEESAHLNSQAREQAREAEDGLQATLSSWDARLRALEQRLARLESRQGMRASGRQAASSASAYTARKVPRTPSLSPGRVPARRASVAGSRKTGSGPAQPRPLVEVKPEHTKVKKGTAPLVEGPAPPPARQVTAPASPARTEAAAVAGADSVRQPAGGDSGAGGLFGKAREAFRRSDYQEAYTLFEQYLNTSPSGPRAAETHYLMGECLFKQQEYDLAVLDYQKVITNYAQSKYAPSALLKQGMCFENIQDLGTARIVYEKLVKDYPDSPQVATARQRLDSM